MKKLVLCLGILATSSFSHAHNVSFDSNNCDISMNGQISMTYDQLRIELPNNASMLIDQDQDLYLDGHQIALTSQQQQWVDDYYQGFYHAVPIAAEIANDAITLAGNAVGEVFEEVFDDPAFGDDLKRKLSSLNQKVQHKFYADDGNIHLEYMQIDQGNFVDDAWQEELETMVEEYVMSSIGRLMITFGTQMLTGSMDDFEQRMTHLGENIERKVEAQAMQIEHKAEQLCTILKQTDEAEAKLNAIPALANLNLFEVDNNHKLM